MKIAVISDIHSNLTALKAVLEDIKKRNVDKIFCLGDIIAKGVNSVECVRLIKENCEVVLRGNCDRHFSKEYDLENMEESNAKDRIIWNCKHINDEIKKYLYSLPFCYEFYMSGSLVRMFHAGPKTDKDIVINEDNYDKKYTMFLPTENTVSQNVADMVLYGHLHHQYMDKLYGKTLINIGSVGNSFEIIRDDEKDGNLLEITNAQYVILDGAYGEKEYGSPLSFEFVKVHYDIDKELECYDGDFEKDKYVSEIKFGRYRDMFKIEKYNEQKKKEEK